MTKNISRLLAVFLAGVMCICSTAPVYALEINDLENLNEKNKIVLKIDHYADLSPK